jgi:hypothetical protein
VKCSGEGRRKLCDGSLVGGEWGDAGVTLYIGFDVSINLCYVECCAKMRHSSELSDGGADTARHSEGRIPIWPNRTDRP